VRAATSFRYSSLERGSLAQGDAFSVRKGTGGRAVRDGFRYKNVLAQYVHLHFGSNPHFATKIRGIMPQTFGLTGLLKPTCLRCHTHMKVLLLEHPRGRSALHFNTIANTPLSSSLLSGYLASLLQSRGIQAELHDGVAGADDFFRGG